jgi:hypothetical protein
MAALMMELVVQTTPTHEKTAQISRGGFQGLLFNQAKPELN